MISVFLSGVSWTEARFYDNHVSNLGHKTITHLAKLEQSEAEDGQWLAEKAVGGELEESEGTWNFREVILCHAPEL